jgi:hypothetical protein
MGKREDPRAPGLFTTLFKERRSIFHLLHWDFHPAQIVEIITSRNLQLKILDSKNFSFCPYIIFSSDHLENSRRQQRQMKFFICNRQSH